MGRIALAALLVALAAPAWAQAPVFCPTRPLGDNTNACASTAFVQANAGGGGGAVLTVSNSNGTLTVSPTTGNVVTSLNLANANTWTALQTFSAGTSNSSLTLSGVTGSTQCLHVNSSGLVSGTGADCGAGGTNLLPLNNTWTGTNTYTQPVTLPITGSVQCLHVNTSGTISGTGSDCGAGGGGGISSVTNSDGTLTFSTTAGAVTGSLNLANNDTWTGNHTFTPTSGPPITVNAPTVPTLIDPTSWGQSSVLMGGNFTAAGNATIGSANQFELNVQVNITGATSSAASYEKAGIFSVCRTADPSATPLRDCVGADTRAQIANTNASGRAWGFISTAQILPGGTGDGLLVGNESQCNNFGTDQGSVNTTTSKYCYQAVNTGTNPATVAYFVAGSGQYHNILYADPTQIATGGYFINLAGKFTIDKTGSLIITTTGPNIGQLISTAGGSVSSVWANTPATGAVNDSFSINMNFSETSGAQYQGAILRATQSVATAGSQSTIWSFYNTNNGGAIAEQLRVYSDGGLAIGVGNIAVDGGAGVAAASGFLSVPSTVSGLPTCNTAAKGQRRFVTDAPAGATTFHTSVTTGGSSTNISVTCDGTNWYSS